MDSYKDYIYIIYNIFDHDINHDLRRRVLDSLHVECYTSYTPASEHNI